jgi:hypothetical protein
VGSPTQGRPRGACLTSVARLAAALAAALLLAGCIPPPDQGGEIAIAAGASERLSMAWRFGYAGVEGPARPATATVLGRGQAIPPEAGTTARAGDVLLENGDVSFVIAAADGTDRGGVVVAAWSKGGTDELGTLRVVVGDAPVLARSVRVGSDAPTRAAWVDVVGTVETASGPLAISTRYDVAPGVEGMLVHSTFVVPEQPIVGAFAVGDAMEAAPPRVVSGTPAAGGAPAALVLSGPRAGYAVIAIDAPWAAVDGERREHGLPVASLPSAPGDLVLFSRFVAVLDRPDPLAVLVVQSREAGRGVGEVEVQAVDHRGLPTLTAAGTRLVFQDDRPGGEEVAMTVPRDLAPGETMLAEVPAGRWTVRRMGSADAEATGVDVVAEQLARARVRLASSAP